MSAERPTLGWRCAVCGAALDIATFAPWRCPNATDDDRHHVLHLVTRDVGRPDPALAVADAPNALVAHDHELAWAAYAEAHGLDETERRRLIGELEREVRAIEGNGFEPTPYGRSEVLSDELGFAPSGGVWVKDETVGVAGSHKARHLVTILLHLRAAELVGHLRDRPPLAIASCGNAALAAATLARAARWPLEVYVPTWMSEQLEHLLRSLGARVRRCERRPTDPPGDPAMLRCREAVARGAVPFTVQGPENALCLDGGRTIGWEVAEQHPTDRVAIDHVYVQVGGGAFLTCLGAGLHSAGVATVVSAVQAQGCAPLARAWELAGDLPDPGRYWSELMTPWEHPESVADGILDDETYDWLGAIEVMRRTGGRPVVAPESVIVAASELADAAGFAASPTGSAGLAGLLVDRSTLDPAANVVVVMSGVRR